MVDRRVTDPVRIAELLASEVTGRSSGPLGALAVVDVDRAAAPSSGGTRAYRLALDRGSAPDSTDHEAAPEDAVRIASVELYPDETTVVLEAPADPAGDHDRWAAALTAGVEALPERDRAPVARRREGGRLALEIGSGAAVKPATDVIAAAVDALAGADGVPGSDGDPGSDGVPGSDGDPGSDGVPGSDRHE